MLTKEDLIVKTLGKCTVRSPLGLSTQKGDNIVDYISEKARVRYQVEVSLDDEAAINNDLFFEKAGPQELIYFNPATTKAAIVTCGGLCPGLNNVIRSVFLEFYYKYGVRNVYGFRYGYKGLNPAYGYYPVELTPDNVSDIHKVGGTFLGSSRGAEDPKVMANTLKKLGIHILIAIGGDGTLRGAHAIHEELEKQGMKIAVVGIPKTIDNDIDYVWKTFGFDTAVEISRQVLDSAHVEAIGAPNGIGLVKLMGRDSGFIAANATIASLEVNFTLIPEVPFDLHGKGALLEALEQRLSEREHAVIVVAEGAGQNLITGDKGEKDASGNIRYKDIGIYLKDEITRYFKEKDIPLNLKYIDPSYYIRSVPANGSDSIFCDNLGRRAVHAAMAGKTDIVIGLWHNAFTHVPIPIAVANRKKIDPERGLWMSVLEATGQPMRLTAQAE